MFNELTKETERNFDDSREQKKIGKMREKKKCKFAFVHCKIVLFNLLSAVLIFDISFGFCSFLYYYYSHFVHSHFISFNNPFGSFWIRTAREFNFLYVWNVYDVRLCVHICGTLVSVVGKPDSNFFLRFFCFRFALIGIKCGVGLFSLSANDE